jgi:hypothetical protein
LHGLAPVGEDSISHLGTAVERANAAVITAPSGFIRMWEYVIPLENIEPSGLKCAPTIQNGHHSPGIHEGT